MLWRRVALATGGLAGVAGRLEGRGLARQGAGIEGRRGRQEEEGKEKQEYEL